MARASITKRTVDAAKPGLKDSFLWDDDVAGFGLKVTPSGGRIYIYQYRIARPGHAERTTMKRFTIGKHGNLTPDQARKRAKELAVMVEQGIDPRQRELDAFAAADEAKQRAEEQARRDTDLAFENVAARWLAEYELGHRPRSYGQAALVVNKHLMPKLASKPLPSIGRADLQDILDGIPARQAATRRTVYAYASIFFGWAFQRGDIAENPLQAMAKPQAPKARDRALADQELATIWKATTDLRQPLSTFYRVLLLTGQRREEVAGMNWAELDRSTATWTIPADRAKNGVAHIVPLASTVVAELDRLALAVQVREKSDNQDARNWPKAGPVMSFTGKVALSCYSQAKAALDAEIAKVLAKAGDEPMAHWRVHDLRRTLATGFQRLGIRFEVTEATLNHVSGAKGGIAGVYQRHDWKEEKRAALDAWARHVQAIVHPADASNIVKIGIVQKSA
ncbi:Prophage CP4-57 integrase [Sphingomonas haloaromaticamans]|uniref:Prophage CP4-57 integrase n=2 Tax=Edaphosphingomonas haloaromaticamans TaxID=653954 RepID=A0A1S1HC54_9SPHN|nr:Prophage CP4-57 integrase [Sphingomonas haloaromaticamans]